MSARQDLLERAFQTQRLQLQYPRFIQSEAKRIADQFILKPIHTQMRSFGYSQKIIDSTKIQNIQVLDTGIITFDVVSDYKSESGFDVSEAREKGTRDHFIAPRRVKSLFFIAKSFVDAFSKGHWVKGITASNVISKTIKSQTAAAQNALDESLDNFLGKGLQA